MQSLFIYPYYTLFQIWKTYIKLVFICNISAGDIRPRNILLSEQEPCQSQIGSTQMSLLLNLNIYFSIGYAPFRKKKKKLKLDVFFDNDLLNQKLEMLFLLGVWKFTEKFKRLSYSFEKYFFIVHHVYYCNEFIIFFGNGFTIMLAYLH